MDKKLLYNLFDSHNDMYIAMTIIYKTYVIKLKNHGHVTSVVNQVISKNFLQKLCCNLSNTFKCIQNKLATTQS